MTAGRSLSLVLQIRLPKPLRPLALGARVSLRVAVRVIPDGRPNRPRRLTQAISPPANPARFKQPYAIALADHGIMALAGLWETWLSPAGVTVRSLAIVTTAPNKLCGEIHKRMPVILKRGAWPVWLGEEPSDSQQLKALLATYPAEEMISWPVSSRVGNVSNNDPSLIEPITLQWSLRPAARSAGSGPARARRSAETGPWPQICPR